MYRGQVHGGPTADNLTDWADVSTGANGVSLVDARSVYVDPYDANDIYVTDLGDDMIKASTDGGKDWTVQSTLEDIASDYGEYKLGGGQFGCNGSIPGSFFAGGCSLEYMGFSNAIPGLRVAVLYPGGLAISRDSGQHWIPLLGGPGNNVPVLGTGPYTKQGRTRKNHLCCRLQLSTTKKTPTQGRHTCTSL